MGIRNPKWSNEEKKEEKASGIRNPSWTYTDEDRRDGYAEKANSVFSDYSKYAEDLSKGIGSWQDNAWFGSMENRSASLASRLKDLRQDNLADDVVPDTQNDAVTDLAIQQLKYRSKLRGLETGLNKSNEMLKSSKNTYGNFSSADEFNEALKQYEKNARYESMTDDELKAELETNDRRIANAREGKDNFLEELGGQLGAMLSGQPYYNNNDKIDENIKGYQRESAIINGVLTDRRLKANAERLRGMTDFDIEHNIVNAQADYDRLQELLGESVQKNVTEGGGDSAIIDQQINEASKRIEQAKADKYDRFRIIASEMQVPDEFDSSSADLKGLYKRGDQSGMFDEADMRFVDSATRRRMEYLYSEAQKTGNWDLVNAYEDIVNNQIAQEGGRELGDFVKSLPEWADALVPIVPSGVSRLASVITGEDAPVATALSGAALGLQSAFDSAMKTVNSFSRDGDTYTYNRASEVASAYIAEDMQGVEKTLWDLWVNTGNQIPHMAVSLITKSKLAGLATMGVQVYGQAIEEGLAMGMTTSEARNYAMIDTALELGLESVLGNMPGVRGVLSEELGERLASTAKTQAAKVALSYLGGAWGEFVEEGLQEVISPVIQKLITDQNLDFSQENVIEKIGDFLYSGMIGAVSSLIMGNTVGQVADITEAMQYDIDTYKEGKQADLGKVKELGTMLDAESNAAKLIKNLSETSSAYDIGLAIQQAHMQMSHETYETIKNKLVESGMTEADSTKNAYILYQMANGETLSREAQFVLQHEDVLASVALEVFGMDSEATKKIRQAMEIRKKGEVVDIDKRYAEMEQAIKTFDDAEAQGNATVDVVARFKKDYSSVSEDTINEYKSILDKSNRFYAESGDLRLAYYTGTIGMDETKARSLAKNISDANFKLMYNRGVIDSKSKVAPKKYTSVVRGVKYEGVDKNQLPESTKRQIAMLDALSKATGVKITIVPASTKENGHYDPVTDTVYLHENAGNLSSGTLIYTAAHEMTHFIKKWNEDGYRKLQSFVTNEVGYSRFNSMVENLMFKKFSNEKGETIKYNREQATEEVVCNMMERVLSDGEVIKRFVEKNRTLAEKVKEWLDDTIAKVKEFLSSDKVDLNIDYEADTIVDSLEDIRNMWADALESASNRYTKTRITLSNVNQLTSKQFEEGMAEQGVAVDTESGSAMFSWKTAPYMWSKSKIEEVAKALAQRFDIPEKVARKQLRDQMALSNLFFNPVYNEALDFAHDENSPLQENSDYGLTVDFSNICRKRLVYTAMIDALQKANPNYVFNGEDYADVRRIMQLTKGEDGKGLEVACGLCYVEDRRQDLGKTAQSFRSALEGYRNGTDKFVFTDGKTLSISEKFSGKLQRVYDALEAINDDYTPTVYDLTTVRGMNDLRKNHPSIADAFEKFNSARGQSAQNLLQNEREYTGQILEHFANAKGGKINLEEVQKFNDHGGLRIYSYSDFIEYHIQDVLQVIQDCANVGLKMQGYTKVVEFAKMVRNTNIKLNLSVIPAGDTGIHNGKLVCDVVEGIDMESDDVKELIKNKNIGLIIIGINHEQVRMAMADSRISYIIPYHTNQDGLSRFLKKTDKWFNYKEEQMEREWVTNDKGELVLKNTDKKKMVNIYTDVLQAAEAEGKPITNRKQFQEKFFEVCEERGIVPRFDRFINKDANGKYVYTPGYEKLLLDYKLFDGNGNILPQEVVQAKFNREELRRIVDKFAGEAGRDKLVQNVTKSATFKLAFNALNDVIKTTGRVYQPEGKFKPIPNAKLGEAAAKVLKGSKESLETNDANYGEELTAKKPRVKNSLKDMSSSELNSTYMEYADRYEADHSVSTGEFLQRLLGEEAVRKGAITNDKGNAQLLYHGTNRFGFTEFSFPRGWFYATTRREVAGNYGGRGYTSVKRIGEIKNAKNLDELIRKYNRRNGTNFRKVTEADFKEYTKKIYDIAEKTATKYDDLYGKYYKTDYIQKMLEDDHLRNLWDWMVDSIYTWQSFGDDYGKDESAVDNLKTSTNKSVETRDELVKYLSDHHDEWKNTDSAPLLKYIMGYEFGDAVANTAWAADKFDADVIEVSKDGYMDFRTEEGLRNYFDDTTGAYELYGFDGGKVLEVDAENHDWLSVKFDGAYHSTDYIAKWAKDNGYTAVLVKNVYDGGPMADEYIFFSPEQVKSADPITYDFNGNIIPLSERFNNSNDDIRYSMKESADVVELDNAKAKWGININTDSFDWVEKILDGKKTIETRSKNVFQNQLGKRIGLVETHKGQKAKLVGYATISDIIRYDTAKEFYADKDKHLVGRNSEYKWNGEPKYGYVLTNVERIKPQDVESKGISKRALYSYKGETAQGNKDNLILAKQMAEDGVSNENIRFATGWFKGMDGKWRYEIDDSGARIQLISWNGEISRLEDEIWKLDKKYENREITKPEHDELVAEATRKIDAIRYGDREISLGRYLNHNELYEAYPQLKDIKVVFKKLRGNVLGEYSPTTNTISLSNNLKGDAEILDTLMHEVQHAIQEIEGFSEGASAKLWESRMDEARSKRSDALGEKVHNLFEKLASEGAERSTLSDLYREVFNRSYSGGTNMSATESALTDKLFTQFGERWYYGSGIVHDYINAIKEEARFVRKDNRSAKSDKAFNLYRNTMGEIEARDVANRRTLTENQRKLLPPDIYNKEAVDVNNYNPNILKYNLKSDTARSLAPTFYSKLERTLESMPKGKYDATTILKTLQGKGVKAEELKWSGLPAYLEGKKSVTAEEMLNVARANRMQIEEVVLDYDDELGKADPNEIRDALETEAYEFFEKQGINIYAEANIVVEKKDRSYIAFAEYDDGRRVEAARYDPNERATRWKKYTFDDDENYAEYLFVDPLSTYTNDAMQTHWRRNGVLVHARVADQMKKGGNKYLITDGATEGKVLFVEEIQSDWHNAGHKYGYSEYKSYEKDEKYKKTINELDDNFYDKVGGNREQTDDLLAEIRWEIRQELRSGKADDNFIDWLVGRYGMQDEEYDKYIEDYAHDVIKAENERKSAMVAPMQNTYQDFAMKKMLRLATESDYQYIGWTTADIQDERWDDNESHDDEDGLSGNLKGYTIEYDQQIPKFMNKFGKQFGTQVEKITLKNNEEVWAMKITPEMRNSVLYEGQPLWSLKDSTTPRQLLADAMAYASKNEGEREIIGKYTAKIEQLDKAEQKAERIRYFIRMDEQIGNGLAELNKELGTKFKTIEEAQAEYDKLRKRIANADSEILRLEAEQPIRKLLNYAKAQQRARTTQLTKERQKRTATRHKIINQLDNYYRMLTKPQKNKYVPASLVTSVIEFLETIDRASGREQEKGKARLAQMALNYEALKNDEDYKEAYDEDTAEMLKKIATQIPDKPLYEMNQEELDMVNDALTQLRTVINDSRKFIGTHIDGFDIDTREIATILARETNSTKRMNMAQQFARHFLDLGANPRVVFNALGGFQKDSYWTKMYRMLEEGTERQNQYNYDVEKIFAPILNDKAKRKEIEAYGDTSKLITLPVKDAKGNPIQMTKGMLLSVYMHLLNDDNARHLLMGGLTIPDMSRYYGNHSRQTAYSNADNRYLGGSADIKALQIETKSATEALEKAQASGDEEAIAKATERLNAVEEEYQRVADELNSMRNQLMMFIQSKMTDTDVEFIHAVQDYFKYSSKRLNEISMQAYGYKKFGVENYFPIVVDRDWLKTDIENFGRTMDQFSVENAGFTKDRVKSRKPMMLIDIMDQVNRSKRMQSLYYGNMIPLRNFKKVYGKVTTDGYVDTPLRKVINSVYASNKEYMTGFIDRLMKNLNGQNPQNTLAWLRGKNAVSALGLNLRVAGSQAASYINALPLLDAHALAVGASTAFKKTDIDLIDKYTKERWARSDQANTMGEATKGKSFLEKSTKLIESVDSWTINRLWYASADYVKRHSDIKEGTEEFYKAVAEKFEEVVRVSQPMYDVIHRPDALRSENVFVRLMTMFYTQRLQNFSQIYESVGEAIRAEADYKEGKATIDELKSARKNFRNNAMAVLGSAGLLTAMKTAIDLAMHRFKGYRDDDDELTWESITNATIKNFAESLASNVLFVNNLWELVDSLVNDETYYGVSLGAADMIVNGSKALYNFFDSFKNAVQSGFDEKKSKVLLNRARNLAKSIGQFFGVPANNIDNIANAIYNWGYSIANGETAEDRDYFKDIFGIK